MYPKPFKGCGDGEEPDYEDRLKAKVALGALGGDKIAVLTQCEWRCVHRPDSSAGGLLVGPFLCGVCLDGKGVNGAARDVFVEHGVHHLVALDGALG